MTYWGWGVRCGVDHGSRPRSYLELTGILRQPKINLYICVQLCKYKDLGLHFI